MKEIYMRDLEFKEHHMYKPYSLRHYKDEYFSIVESIDFEKEEFKYEILFLNNSVLKVEDLLDNSDFEDSQVCGLTRQEMLIIVNKIYN